MKIRTALAALAVMLAVAVAAAPAAFAKDGDLRVSGTCTRSSTVKLKLSDEDGRLEVEFEVDQNRNGVPWKVVLRRNGTLVTSATAVTRAPSGSFELRRVLARAGATTRIAARAKSPSGETCTVSASA